MANSTMIETNNTTMAEQARVIHRDDRRTSDVIGPSSTGVQPAPLTSTCSSTRSDATTALDGQKQQPQPEYPKSPLPPIQTPENDGETSQNVAVRFLHATQNVLLSSYVNILLVFVPVGIAAHTANLPSGVVFGMNAVAIMPLARLLSYATESVASGFGDTVGALMSVTFGNAVELIIFIIALSKNHIRIVQASLVGSILVNLLLVLGMSFLLGGLRFREQVYNSTVTQMSACLLALSVTSLLLPTAFHLSFSSEKTADYRVLQVSRGTSVIVLVVYFLYLIFQLKSHSYIYAATPQEIIERETVPGPAAHYFESSTSGSESSDSELDGSASRRRRRRIVRKNKKRGTISRNHPAGTNSSSATVIATRTMSSTLGGNSITDDEGVLPMGSEADDEKGVTVHSEGRSSESSGHAARLSRQPTESERSSNPDERPRPLSAESQAHTRSSRSVIHPDIEAQQEPEHRDPLFFLPRRTSTRTTRPTTAHRSSLPPGTPQPGIQRAWSEPVNRRHSQQPRDPTMRPVIGPFLYNNNHPPPPRPTSDIEAQIPTHQSPIPEGNNNNDKDNANSDHPSRTTAILLLLLCTALVAVHAEFMVSSIASLVATDQGISEAFIGLILLPIVGNAAEHVTAVGMALRNKLDLAIGVAVGSSVQMALFVTPAVVVLGWGWGKEMGLFFTLFETVCVFVSAFIVNFLVLDGRSNYLEGALLCSAYVIVAVAAFFYPDGRAASELGGGP